MIAMRKMKLFLTLIMAFVINFQGHADEIVLNKPDLNAVADTILRTDTIIVNEVIERQDVIYRTEKVIRYKDNKGGNKSEEIMIQGSQSVIPSQEIPIIEPSPANDIPQLSESPENGNYIWVPDSLNKPVMDLLHGRYVPNNGISLSEEQSVDPNEKVIFRGDTIPMILRDRNLGRYDRGLFNFLYIPKGIWQVGLTASYGEFSTEDLQILDLVSDIDFYGHIFSVKPYFQYFLKNNVSLGLRLGYTAGKARIGTFNMEIDEDMSFNLHDILYKSSNYSAGITLTQYLGITRRGRFGVFNEVELALAGGSSDFNRPYNGEMRRTHTTVFETALNFSPGISVYMLEQLSFNVSFGVFGLNIKHEKQKVNEEPMGERTTSGANFRFNIFNINFGIAVNI